MKTPKRDRDSHSPADLSETRSSWIAEETSLEGTLRFSGINRVFGELRGTIIGLPGSHLIFMETSRVIGDVVGEEVTVNGRVEGKVTAARRVTVASLGRIIGEVRAPDLLVDFGGVIEGEVFVKKDRASPAPKV